MLHLLPPIGAAQKQTQLQYEVTVGRRQTLSVNNLKVYFERLRCPIENTQARDWSESTSATRTT